jgi:hypothetical protein
VEGVTAVRKDTQYVILVIFRKANSALSIFCRIKICIIVLLGGKVGNYKRLKAM